jgi:hypothetical protein
MREYTPFEIWFERIGLILFLVGIVGLMLYKVFHD